jgi:NTP pyrophosphatase (non-canonical NTP hydrolase)
MSDQINLTSQERQSIYEKVTRYYSTDKQIDVAIEELSELIKVLAKRNRYEQFIDFERDLIDECADVLVMVEQIIFLFDIHQPIQNRIDFKLDRLLKRIIQDKIKNTKRDKELKNIYDNMIQKNQKD